jgi:hypothetical protein
MEQQTVANPATFRGILARITLKLATGGLRRALLFTNDSLTHRDTCVAGFDRDERTGSDNSVHLYI